MLDYTRNPRFKYFFAILVISLVFVGSFTVLAFQPISIPVEVKEAIEILDYPASGFSLFAGENMTFEITVQNLASVTHFAEFDFQLNDTDYQTKYVTFSNYTYNIPTGTQTLSAWIKIAQTAPPANLMLTINRKTDTPSPSSSPTTSYDSSQTLFGGGARWAAREGKTALYVNWKDSWLNHYSTDGSSWVWVSHMDERRSSVLETLEQWGFEVTCVGDIPENLSDYNLVVLEASYAVEPKHAPLIKEYISKGGGVVILSGVPCFFSVYCKDWWPYRLGGTDLTSIQEWFGCSVFVNTGGVARAVVNNPFGTSLQVNDVVYTRETYDAKAVVELNSDAQVIARWDSSEVYAFTYEYGEGRVFYQGGLFIAPST